MQYIYRKMFLHYPGITDKDFKLVDNGDGVVKLATWGFPAPRPDLAALDSAIPDKTVTDEITKQQQGGTQEDLFKAGAGVAIKFLATFPGAPKALVDIANTLP